MASMEVRRREGESTGAMLRRFSRLIQASGLINQARRLRFKAEGQTRRQRRLSALHRVKMRKHYEQLYKLGKPVEEKQKRRGR